jgi:hypothetical protein
MKIKSGLLPKIWWESDWSFLLFFWVLLNSEI